MSGNATIGGIVRSGGRMWVQPGMTIKASQAAVAYTGTSASSSAFSVKTQEVLCTSTTDCFITFAASPTATTSSHFLPAYTPQRFTVPYDGATAMKVAAIQLNSAGNLYVSELG